MVRQQQVRFVVKEHGPRKVRGPRFGLALERKWQRCVHLTVAHKIAGVGEHALERLQQKAAGARAVVRKHRRRRSRRKRPSTKCLFTYILVDPKRFQHAACLAEREALHQLHRQAFPEHLLVVKEHAQVLAHALVCSNTSVTLKLCKLCA